MLTGSCGRSVRRQRAFTASGSVGAPLPSLDSIKHVPRNEYQVAYE